MGMSLSELSRLSMALRWLVTLPDHGDVPGEIQATARVAYENLEAHRRKFFRPESIERSIYEAWRPTEGQDK